MHRWIAILALILAASQDLSQKVDEALKAESARCRTDILELVRKELGGESLVTADLLRKHAEFLANDDLQGRNTGYPGNDKAADYIAGAMKKAGLKPAGDGGTYFQNFTVQKKFATRNCVGVWEGTDPELKKEFVVLGAHYDHVGTDTQEDHGRLGKANGEDHIWNGADDNASGTSTMLGVARAFGEGNLKCRRSVLFLAFSGEEAGLKGSEHYVQNPIAPIRNHVFMLNLDMVGRNPDKPIGIHGVGSAADGAVRGAFERALPRSGLQANVFDEVKVLGGDSDHTSFKAKGVPFAFFFSGFHADYHRPTDHADKLAYDNMVKVANTAVDALTEIANAEARPRFAWKVERRLDIRGTALSEQECNDLKLPAGQGGLRVGELVAGGAADGAGMKKDDVILSVAGEPLSRTDPRARLQQILAEKVVSGVAVPVEVLRSNRRMTLHAKWLN